MVSKTQATSTDQPMPRIQAPKVDFSMSRGLVPRLSREKFPLGFPSYRSGKLYMLGCSPEGVGQMCTTRSGPADGAVI